MGFQKGGFDVVAGYDNWNPAIATHKYNFTNPVHKIDLFDAESASDHIRQYAPDMIIGGPPCQDFSSAGLRNEDNGRGDLTISYAKIISNINPRWFVMENVSTITKTRKLAEAKSIFKEAGYGLTQIVLDASLCGVPQKRKRFFLVGHLGEQDDFMYDFIYKRLSPTPMSVKDYFGDTIDIEFYYRHPRSYARRGVFSVNEPSPTIRGVNRPIPAGYKIHPNDPVDSLEGVRPLTTHERSRIQTFPEDFIFCGTRSEIEQMIGNAVPVDLGAFVAKCIKDFITTNPD